MHVGRAGIGIDAGISCIAFMTGSGGFQAAEVFALRSWARGARPPSENDDSTPLPTLFR